MSNILKMSEAAAIAIHAAVFMASENERVCSTGRIAETLKASEAHLSKVLQQLNRAGLVRSIRGPRGGFILGRGPGDISLLEVFETIEGPFMPSGCLFDLAECPAKRCILGDLLRSSNQQFRDHLAGTKLSDLADIFGSEPNA